MAAEEIQDAVIRNIEVIGEAGKRVSPESRSQLADVDWKRVCGMRDVQANRKSTEAVCPCIPAIDSDFLFIAY